MLRSLGFSAFSNFSRFLASGVLFIALAALWLPDMFGRFVFHHVLALVAAMVVDYGLALRTMREVAHAPRAARSVLRSTLAAQLLLVPLSGLLGVGFWTAGLIEEPALFALLWLAHVLFNFVNTGYGACRGLGRHDVEARIALVGNVFLCVLPLAVAWTEFGPEAVAAAMVTARLLQALATAAHLSVLPAAAGPARESARRVLRHARVYALENWVSALFQNADSLIVRLMLGEAALGIYQAGARFMTIAIILAQSVGNLLVPSLTAALADRRAFRRSARRTTMVLGGLGLASFAGLALLGGPVADLLYGEAYAGVAQLMPLFGVVACLRCIAASQGFVLLALDQQAYRFLAVLGALGVFLAAGPAGAMLGVSGVIWANALSVAALLALYRWRAALSLPPSDVGERRSSEGDGTTGTLGRMERRPAAQERP